MPTNHRAALANIKRFDQLIAYLRDEMAWPIEGDNFDEMTFEYTPEELGIDVRNTAKIQEIKRLRPLAPNQPWGIFFVKFEPKQLPVMALRRILGQVVVKKRASANSSERQAWAAEDLLFVSNYGEGNTRQISFAHFATPNDGRDLPTLKVLGWDNRNTALHLDTVARELTEHLAWPDDEDSADAWREQWRAAFTLRHREVITTSHELSVRLAELARTIRDRIQTALAIETERGPLKKLMKAFQEALVHDLDANGFADMYAQTIAYGLLSARIADPDRKTANDFAGHMRTNPFLRDLMETFLQVGSRHTKPGAEGIDFDELGVAEVVELLDNANMEAVVRDFGDRNPREDPVIHFYERFLAEYDKEQRMTRGVFYTPHPVVSYIIRSVHALLRSEFGLKDGLADTTTWGEMAQRREGLKIPDSVSPDQNFVQILDPATGTGTFLVEAIDVIHGTLLKKWRAQGRRDSEMEALWNEYVPRHLLPRLHGYELLMAPYAIAHLKIGLKLYETGYRFGSNERARVYLTNALEPAQDFLQKAFDFAIPALAEEAQAVNEVKRSARFTVVIGNPPYSGHSANKGAWVRELLRGRAGKQRAENYFEVDGGPLNERNPKWLNDDYVKFIRLAHWQIEHTARGILGFITNHSYLDNPTFRGMRESLAATFPAAYLLDLHGNAKKKERAPDGGKEENVFDIQQGVALGIFIKEAGNRCTARLHHAELWKLRESKYETLFSTDVISTKWTVLQPQPPFYLFVPQDTERRAEYERGWKITEALATNVLGFQTHRDHFAVDFDESTVRKRIEDLRNKENSDEELRALYALRDNRDWKLAEARDQLRKDRNWDRHLIRCLYRPFDWRPCYFSTVAMDYPRRALIDHVAHRENLCLLSSRQQATLGYKHVWVSKEPAESCVVSTTSREGNQTFPLYLFPMTSDVSGKKSDGTPALLEGRRSNLNPEFVAEIEKRVKLSFVPEGKGDLKKTFGPEDVFHYIYAVLHAPTYRNRYAEFLKIDFPRVPLTSDAKLFRRLCGIGNELAALHLMEDQGTDLQAAFVDTSSNQVDKVRYEPPTSGLPGRVWINRKQYFENIEPEIWAFTIGGYRPAEKWLKDRKGRMLSGDDIDHYQKIVAALGETRRLMAEIDEIIGQHGGWPGAFLLTMTGGRGPDS